MSAWRRQRPKIQILCVRRLDVFYVTVSSEMNLPFEGKFLKIQNIFKGSKMSHPAGNLLSSGGKQPTSFQKPLKVTRFISCSFSKHIITSKELYKTFSALSLPRRSRDQMRCLEEAQSTWAAFKKHPLTCWVACKLCSVLCFQVPWASFLLVGGKGTWSCSCLWVISAPVSKFLPIFL